MSVPDGPNIADWVSAVGTAGAATFTAIVYYLDRRRLSGADRRAAREKQLHISDIATEAVRLAEEAKKLLGEYAAMQSLNPGMKSSYNEKLRMDVGRVMRRLNELRQVAAISPRLYSGIGQLTDHLAFIDGVSVSSNTASVAIDCKKAIPLIDGSLPVIKSFIVPDLIQGRGTHHDT